MSISDKKDKILENIAKEAGELLLTLYDKELIEQKKGKHDYATDADIKTEELIISRLQREKLPYTLVAEEKLKGIKFPLKLGLINIDSEDLVLYIDPLEGTHNFTRRRKEFGFGVTLGLVKNSYPIYVVFYNPVTKELYKAIRDEGAYLNAKRIHVSDRKSSLDIIFNHWPDVKHAGKYLDKLRGGDERITDYTPTSCSDAVDITMVARGSADGLVFVYKKADPWDIIPALLIEEAGGIVTNIRGSPWYRTEKDGFIEVRGPMIAGSKCVYRKLFNLYNQ